MRAAIAALSLVLILAASGSAAAQTFSAPAPLAVTGADPAAMLLIGNLSPPPPGQARAQDLAALKTLAFVQSTELRKQHESRSARTWWSLALAGSGAMVALLRARHRRPDRLD